MRSDTHNGVCMVKDELGMDNPHLILNINKVQRLYGKVQIVIEQFDQDIVSTYGESHSSS